jgi:hypothetical protein
MFLALLLLFAVPPAALYAQSAPDSGDNGKALPLFDVDRADDNVTAQACTDAPNDCSLRGAIIRANQTVSATVYLSVDQNYQLTIPPDAVNDQLISSGPITLPCYVTWSG